MSTKLARIFVIACLAVGLPALATALLVSDGASPAKWQDKVDHTVLNKALTTGKADFFIRMAEQADVSGAAALKTKEEKGVYVYVRLTSVANATQAPVKAQLKAHGAFYQSFWISNMLHARGDIALIQTMAQRTDVERILPMGRMLAPKPVEEEDVTRNTNPNRAVTSGLALIGAPDAWALGYTGQGAVVGGSDTGVRWEHESLKNQYRGWNGIDNVATHDYNWRAAAVAIDCLDDNVPCDGGDHGTHTMGTMVGDNGSTEQIGIAPGAKWIGCRNHHEGTAATLATYLSCMEFMLAPTRTDGTDPDPTLAPDAVNNSWSCAEGCGHTLVTPLENSVAAGIFYAASAGNDGPTCSTDTLPLSVHKAAVSTASTIHSGANVDKISGFSSRGPAIVDMDANGLPLPSRTSPDISAPGSTVRSATTGTANYGNKSGTSMATPHVAGMAAVLISANENLRGKPVLIEQVMRDTAVQLYAESNFCGGDNATTYPNNTFGYGRIDVLAAVQYVTADADNDGEADLFDNCTNVVNPSQCNSNAGTDDFGNHCDADLDDDGIVNSFDLTIMRSNFGMSMADPYHVADLNCDGIVNSFDLTIMRSQFGLAPGPGNAN